MRLAQVFWFGSAMIASTMFLSGVFMHAYRAKLGFLLELELLVVRVDTASREPLLRSFSPQTGASDAGIISIILYIRMAV
jgi:hypothetical protein